MASYRKRGNSWQVQVRRKGFSPLTATFDSKAEALCWANSQEHTIDRGSALTTGIHYLSRVTIGELLRRYETTVSAKKRGADREAFKIRVLLRSPMADVPACNVTSGMIASYRDHRLAIVKPATVRRELAILRHCLEIARIEWGLPLQRNPFRDVKLPSVQDSRNRRLARHEWVKIETALQGSKAWYLAPMVELAIETGLRRGELLGLEWCNVDLERRLAALPMTKNGSRREVPLTKRAVDLLSAVPAIGRRIFPVRPGTFGEAWERLVRRAGLTGLRFHDLRHEAISRFFEMGLSLPEVALISGHRDYKMLFRYTHIRAEDIVAKL